MSSDTRTLRQVREALLGLEVTLIRMTQQTGNARFADVQRRVSVIRSIGR